MREEELGIREEAPAAEPPKVCVSKCWEQTHHRARPRSRKERSDQQIKRLSILVPRDRARSNFDDSALEGFKASPVMGRTPPVSKSFSASLFDLGRSRSGMNLESMSHVEKIQ